ncbi:uncharacterized protein I303_101439 [Kwoniella dejecticola CBS 10117]|uniref:AAA+ ATPase domain-containing protein n=1 Tax=Kwoniella dejecticola CBS 10117 TaxID=1296121 RepID=A0A1A6AHR4_9TREE|nr:uncharacterized protein I303_01449 [Kwoniella dejecticola CBS 10117]OBR89620.1 hypothetical protein I303_01449 [Kwoniella dejecticola CBS 10117]
MRSLLQLIAYFVLLQACLAFSLGGQQVAWTAEDSAVADHKPGNPFKTFVEHFSASRSGTDTFLQTQLGTIYPNSSIVVTQNAYFDIFRYAAGSSESIVVRELEDVQSIKKTVFIKPSKRKDGAGVVAERVVFGGYQVAWKDKEFKIVVATWAESYRQVTQWHIITEEPDAAQQFIRSCSAYCSTFIDVVWVFEQGFWRPDKELWQSVQKASWDDVVLDDKFKTSLQNDYRSFCKSEKVYKDLGVPWKRGLIFLGPPGNGKTISLKALMKEVKVPTLYVKSFHSYGGDEKGIRDIFSQARAQAPCVLILEDLDSLITDMNRSFFLNEVDGLEDNDGLLLIGTTNHFDRLDPALSSRPSRFDRKYTFPNPSRDQRRDYAIWWQDRLHDNKDIDFPDSLLDEFADKTDDFSFAYMKEAFVSTLLTIASRKETYSDKPDFGAILLEQVEHLRKELETTEVASVPMSNGGTSGRTSMDEMMGYGHNPMEMGQDSTIFRIPWVNY